MLADKFAREVSIHTMPVARHVLGDSVIGKQQSLHRDRSSVTRSSRCPRPRRTGCQSGRMPVHATAARRGDDQRIIEKALGWKRRWLIASRSSTICFCPLAQHFFFADEDVARRGHHDNSAPAFVFACRNSRHDTAVEPFALRAHRDETYETNFTRFGKSERQRDPSVHRLIRFIARVDNEFTIFDVSEAVRSRNIVGNGGAARRASLEHWLCSAIFR